MRTACDFIILSTARSGSTNLVTTLDQHPQISCRAEIFDDIRVHAHWNQRKILHREMIWAKRIAPDLAIRLAFPVRREASVRYGFKVMGAQIWKCRLADYLKQQRDRGVKFIHLVRRSSLDQAVSLLRAQKTGVWHWEDKPNPVIGAPDLCDFSGDTIRDLVRDYDLMKAAVKDLAADLGALDVFFEDFPKQDAFYRPILAFLGVDPGVSLGHAQRRLPEIGELTELLRQRHSLLNQNSATGALSVTWPDRRNLARPSPPPWQKLGGRLPPKLRLAAEPPPP